MDFSGRKAVQIVIGSQQASGFIDAQAGLNSFFVRFCQLSGDADAAHMGSLGAGYLLIGWWGSGDEMGKALTGLSYSGK